MTSQIIYTPVPTGNVSSYASMAWYNQASSILTPIGYDSTHNLANAINLYNPTNGGNNNITGWRQQITTPVSTPFTFIAHLTWNPGIDDTNTNIGIGFDDGTQVEYLNIRFSSTETASWSVDYFTNNTTFNRSLAGYQDASGFPWSKLGWFMIRNDGSNMTYHVGDETGKNFYKVATDTVGGFLTPTYFGVYGNAKNHEISWSVDSWKVVLV